jgi:hypothetical protein
MKPAEYRHSCTVSKDLPYSVVDQSRKETQPSVGTLHTGRVVWLDHDLETFAGHTAVRAYVDGIGLIRVDPGSLSAVC